MGQQRFQHEARRTGATQVRMPPLPDNSRMVPTTATVSTMPDMCGSSASSAITGISGSTGITSCFHTRTCSHSRKS